MADPHILRQLTTNLDRLLQGDISRDEFRMWFAQVLWTADELDEVTAALVYDVEIAFAELDAQTWSPEQFENEMARISKRALYRAAS